MMGHETRRTNGRVVARRGRYGLSVSSASPVVLAALTMASAVFGGAGCLKKHKPPPMTRVWLGEHHGCSTLKAGGLACWGDGTGGQLGDGSTRSHPLPAPALVQGTLPDELSLGARHSCGIFEGGHVRCWGDGTAGALGDGNEASHVATAPVEPARPLVARAIASRHDRTCAIDAASHGLICWGGGRATPFDPRAVAGLALSAVAIDDDEVCVAVASPREVRCFDAWRDSSAPSAPAGASAGTPSSLPNPSVGSAGTNGSSSFLSGLEVTRLTAGGNHFCALLRDASIRCWGANDAGQLGDGTTRASREPVLVHGLDDVVEIAAGTRHTCARLRRNTLACWGDNRFSQLSNGTADPSARPLPFPGLAGVLELVAAGDGACARLVDGGVRCWGRNDVGQLGDGTTDDHPVPMPIKW